MSVAGIRSAVLLPFLAVACSGSNGPLQDVGSDLADGGLGDLGPSSCEADSNRNPYVAMLRGDAGAFLIGSGYAMPWSVALHDGRVYWTALAGGEEGIYSALPNGCDRRKEFATLSPRFLKFSGDRAIWLGQDQSAIFTADPLGAQPIRLGQASSVANIGVVGDRVYGMGNECNLISYKLGGDPDPKDHGPNLPTNQGGYLVAGDQTVVFSCRGIGAVYAYDVTTSSISTIVRSDFEYLGVALYGDEIFYAETECTDYRATCPGWPRAGCCPSHIVAYDRRTRERREVWRDEEGSVHTIAFAPDGTLYYSTRFGMTRRRPGALTVERFRQEAIVDQFAFADGFVYWANTRLLTDTTSGPGWVMRMPW